MGHVLNNGLDLMSTATNPCFDVEAQKKLNNLQALAAKMDLTMRERQHVQAIELCGKG